MQDAPEGMPRVSWSLDKRNEKNRKGGVEVNRAFSVEVLPIWLVCLSLNVCILSLNLAVISLMYVFLLGAVILGIFGIQGSSCFD